MTVHKPIPSLTVRQEARFWERVTGAELDAGQAKRCWLWTGYLNPNGYGRYAVRVNGSRTVFWTHRIAYTILRGPIPDGYTLDHLCRNRACCNPSHLEPVPSRENTLRGIGASARHARMTHCKLGHELSIVGKRRRCVVCRRAYDKRRKAKS